jgi:hypothetical protein
MAPKTKKKSARVKVKARPRAKSKRPKASIGGRGPSQKGKESKVMKLIKLALGRAKGRR